MFYFLGKVSDRMVGGVMDGTTLGVITGVGVLGEKGGGLICVGVYGC